MDHETADFQHTRSLTDIGQGASSTSAPEWFLSALRVSSLERRTVSQGCPIAYRSWGHGDRLVVLAHGRSANSHWWDHIAPSLQDCRVVAVDFSGHGESGRRSTYEARTWAAELGKVITIEQARLINEHGTGRTLRNPVLVGHSMGASVSLMLAAQGSPPLHGVIAIDPPIGVPHGRSEQLIPRRRTYRSRYEAENRFRILPTDPFTPAYMVRYLASHSVRQESTHEWTSKTDPLAMVPNVIRAETLGHSEVPALLVTGSAGLATSESLAALLTRMKADVVSVPQCGHHILLDKPEALISIIREQLERWKFAST